MKKHTARKFIIKSITYVMAVIFMMSIAALDSEPFYIPITTLSISGAWLAFMAWVHGLI